MIRPFLFILGIFFTSIGLFFIILYFNLLTMGYSFWSFVQFISRRGECLLFPLGIILILISMGRWIKNELLLRCHAKLGRRRSNIIL